MSEPQETSQPNQEQPKPIDALTEQELRLEIIEGINETLGKLALGPVAAGTGALGYGREWDWKKEYDKGIILPLFCSYIRFTKAFEADEQTGVRLELLGIMRTGRMYVDLKSKFDEDKKRVDQMTPEEKENFEKFAEIMEAQKEAIERDDLAPSENRYYFIPLENDKPGIISTESFITRASRVNPQDADTWIGEENVDRAEKEDASPVEPITGLPKLRNVNLQDLRDAAVIIRGYKNFVKEIIERTPKDFWGRAGLTE